MSANQSPDFMVKMEIFARLASAYLDKAGYDNASTMSGPQEVTEYVYTEGYHSVYVTRNAEILQVSMPRGYDFDGIQECWRLFCGRGIFFAYYTEQKTWVFCANLNHSVQALLKEYRSHCLSQAYASLVWYLDNMEKYGDDADPYGYSNKQSVLNGLDVAFSIPFQPRNKLYRL